MTSGPLSLPVQGEAPPAPETAAGPSGVAGASRPPAGAVASSSDEESPSDAEDDYHPPTKRMKIAKVRMSKGSASEMVKYALMCFSK